MRETQIDVAYPAADKPHLRIALGACRLAARPGEGGGWVVGTYRDPTERRPLRIVEEEAGATITEAEPSIERIPAVFGGVPRYELDFGGILSRDAEVSIETGLSGVEISVPGSTRTRVAAETTLGSVDVGDGFTKKEGVFLTEAALSGDGPLLRIRAGVRLGSLQLRAT